MIKYLFLLSLICLPLFGKTQVFFPDRKVYASAGKVMPPPANALWWQKNTIIFTLGEPFTVVNLYAIPNRRLNSGFIQPDGLTIAPGVSAIIAVSDPFIIAPNPVSDYAMIKAPSEWEGEVLVHLMDNSGKLIQSHRMMERTLSLDFQQGISPGMYFLNLYNPDGSLLQQNKIIKSN